jgi:hypothetical protein
MIEYIRVGISARHRLPEGRGHMGRILGAFWKGHAILLRILGFPAALLNWLMSLSWRDRTPVRQK